MSILNTLQSLEAAIKGFFVHIENISADLKAIKMGLGVAEEVVNVVAPGSPVAVGINIAEKVIEDLESAEPTSVVNNP